MTIRHATEQDKDSCQRLFTDYCSAMHETGDADRFWNGRPRDTTGTVLILEVENTDVGFGSLLLSPLAVSPFILGVTQMFYVSPQAKRYSGMFMLAGLRYYKEKGCTKATMFCTDKTNAFWAKHKYRPLATLMERTL